MLSERIRIFEEGFSQVKDALSRLLRSSDARAVLLIDRDGRVITNLGETGNLDLASFATLSAADFAATGQLANLLGEPEFSTLYHQGQREHIYYSLITQGIILALIFDDRTTLGLVRVRVKNTTAELARLFEVVFRKEAEAVPIPEEFSKEAEAEIERLFG